jgi:hypothetical protein
MARTSGRNSAGTGPWGRRWNTSFKSSGGMAEPSA